MQWDLFCHVVDNFGDIGVCWRLSADLASRGERVRLWVDDPSALAWMAPDGAHSVTVLRWDQHTTDVEPGGVVIEAFGCNTPAAFVQRMAALASPPLWINLEYLSAESYVERSHRLPSPQLTGVGAGLIKWFFYPGFTAGTGGLIRETGLMQRQRDFEPGQWLASHGWQRRDQEQVVSLFCYDNPALARLLESLAEQPTLLLATAGQAGRQVEQILGPTRKRGALRAALLPYLSQIDYDHLLWASDFNFVRGEDSFVRAQWAAKPFLWQIYPQQGAAHSAKLDAFLDRFLSGADPGLAAQVRSLSAAWNGFADAAPSLRITEAWRSHNIVWRDRLLAQGDLATQLLRFSAERR
jgi:uncharacterized repeat protein (TIGR03837 family)